MMASTVGDEASHRLYPWVLAFWVLFGFWTVVQSEHLPPNTYNDTEICRSIDIRNSGEMFESLKNCTVVEGYVQILLFDNMNTSLFENVSFPKLKEITGYLLLYRVSGLVNLGQLFPNLAVIRGQQPLLLEHSLIIFEMPSLQEINLYSLTNIMNGLIRIDKNPQLCFVHTVDWKRIAHIQDGHFIKSIKNEDECPVCPTNKTTGVQCRFCWNHQNCQKICNCKGDTRGRACNSDGTCCDDRCLGGCSVSPGVCDVCRNFVMTVNNTNKCFKECPASKTYRLYPYLGRRCLTAEECINLPKYVEISNTNTKQEYSYKIHDNTCIAKCPMNFMEEKNTCVHCAGRCKKVCPGISIDNLESATSLTGCTHINGSLEIEVRAGENIVKGLKEHLKMIEEIDGYLKIVRSFPLISLNFFKSLEVIHGNILESDKHSFIVLDNQNLQEIWNWTDEHNNTRKFRIGNGKLFFHFNPKLCYAKILELQKQANLSNFTDLEVARNSNGDKTACTIVKLEVRLEVKGSTSVQMYWPPFEITDSRKLLAYQVYYKEAPFENVTLYDSRDACGQDGWIIHDVEIPRNHHTVDKINATLQSLKAFMKYAFYVKTYTIAQEMSGAQSDIRYFVTNPGQPSEPTSITVLPNSSNSIYASWGPPATPKGNLTHYRVTVILRKESPPDYKVTCATYNRGRFPTTPKPSVDLPTTVMSNNTCTCSEGDNRMGMRLWTNEREKESQINFENDLQNRVYLKQQNTKQTPTRKSRRRRQLFPTANDTDANGSNVNGEYIAVYNVVGKSIYITNLKHFTFYKVAIQACREVAQNKGDIHPSCSNLSATLRTVRTKRKVDADNISSELKKVQQTENSITISWEPPKDPNGDISLYMIEYMKQDFSSAPLCTSHKDFVNQSNQFTLKNLDAGNYSIRVQAITDSGSGEYSIPLIVVIKETSKSTSLTIGVIIATVVIVIALAAVYVARKFKRQESPRMNPSINPEYSYIPDDWEVPRKQIELHKELGQGSFGMVYEGIAREIKGTAQMRCAIKTVNEHATNGERANFLQEASVMKAFDTSHVIKLLGVVSEGQPTLVIMELMANGDLKSYLRSHRPDTDGYTHGIIRQPPSLKRILQMAIEIADGMAYLSAKKFVHRDLAARNCMVAEDLTVKIGDFGMTRDIYETDYYRKGTKGLLPVRWMAPESLKDGLFSSSSDVWSYGVVLWEMATLASQPYQGLSNDQALRHVVGGGIMMAPENCPDKLHMLMIQCWKYKCSERPSFLDLCFLLLEDASPQFNRISFYHSAAGIEARAAKSNQLNLHDDVIQSQTKESDENFPLNSSSNDSEMDENLQPSSVRLQYPRSYPKVQKDSANTNGYVGTNASNCTRA